VHGAFCLGSIDKPSSDAPSAPIWLHRLPTPTWSLLSICNRPNGSRYPECKNCALGHDIAAHALTAIALIWCGSCRLYRKTCSWAIRASTPPPTLCKDGILVTSPEFDTSCTADEPSLSEVVARTQLEASRHTRSK
jgi:hypothetical protein